MIDRNYYFNCCGFNKLYMSSYDIIEIIIIIIALILSWNIQFPKPKVDEKMKRKLVSDVIKLIQNTKSRRQKVNIIKTNLGKGLVGILRLNYDKSLQLDVDLDLELDLGRNGTPIQSLNKASNIWASFLTTAPHPRSRKNIRFKIMLEGLEPCEALLFLEAAKRNIDLGISRFTLKRCFPQIFKSV